MMPKVSSEKDLSNETAAAFFRFMQARERIRLEKGAGKPWPWSDDPILNTFKFTNVKREHDRTTRWMREHWTGPNEAAPAGEIIFNCALFRYFGTIEFGEAVGWRKDWEPDEVIAIASKRASGGLRVFTGAYIIPTLGNRGPKYEAICRHVLTPLWAKRIELGDLATATRSWRSVGEQLMKLPGFGGNGFMAKETLQDVMHTWVLKDAVDRNSWCPAGPGARRGLNRVFKRPVAARIPFEQALEEMIVLFRSAIQSLPPWMPELELHDIQFQLCEFDKYERAKLGEGRPKARYVRQEQKLL